MLGGELLSGGRQLGGGSTGHPPARPQRGHFPYLEFPPRVQCLPGIKEGPPCCEGDDQIPRLPGVEDGPKKKERLMTYFPSPNLQLNGPTESPVCRASLLQDPHVATPQISSFPPRATTSFFSTGNGNQITRAQAAKRLCHQPARYPGCIGVVCGVIETTTNPSSITIHQSQYKFLLRFAPPAYGTKARDLWQWKGNKHTF